MNLLPNSKLNSIFALHTITGFAGSLIGIFIPAYLFTLGFPLASIFSYYLVCAVSVFVFFLIAAYIGRRFGVRLPIIASVPFTLAYLITLYSLSLLTANIFLLVACLQGAGAGLYWFGLNTVFAANAEFKHMGNSVGKLFGLPQIFGLIGPLAGGVIAAQFGFPALIVFAGCVFFLSLIPLLWLPKITVKIDFDFKTFVALFRKFRRYTLIEFFENIREELEAVVWPLFIFILLRNALSLGLIGTLASIGSIAFTLIIGRYTDRLNPKIFMRIGAIAMAGIWVARAVAPAFLPLVYISTLVSGFLACLILVPFSSYIYGTAKRNTPAEFLVYREIPVTLARVVIYSIAICIASMTMLFPIGAIASALILLF